MMKVPQRFAIFSSPYGNPLRNVADDKIHAKPCRKMRTKSTLRFNDRDFVPTRRLGPGMVLMIVLVAIAVLPQSRDATVQAQSAYVNGSGQPSVQGPFEGTSINSLVGADTFYNQDYTGTNAVIANIEAGHIWSGHETLTHVLQIPNHPSVLNEFDRHATWVGMILGGRRGGTNPGPYQEGMAPDAQLYSGAVATQWDGAAVYNRHQQFLCDGI